jgi:hypothetical protein
VSVLEDPAELGRRISAARGYAQMQRPAYAKEMGVSVPTLRRIEEGDEGSLGRSVEQRRQIAERAMRVAKAPAEVLGLSPADGQEATDFEVRVRAYVRRELEALGVNVDQETEQVAAADLAAAEDAVEQQLSTRTDDSEERRRAAGNE